MFTPERIEEIIANANAVIHKADRGIEDIDGRYIARHELRDLSVLTMYLYDRYRAQKEQNAPISTST
jgi:hypothetical protein